MGSATVAVRAGRGVIAERIAALAGAVSVLVGVTGSSIGDTGGKGINPTMGPEAILRGVQPLVGQLQASAALISVAAVLLLVFLGPLWRRLRTSAEWVAVIGVSGGVVAAALFTGYAYDALALATAAEAGDGTTAQVLTTSGWETARVLAVPFLAMVVAAVVAGATPGVLPPWFPLVQRGDAGAASGRPGAGGARRDTRPLRDALGLRRLPAAGCRGTRRQLAVTS